MKYIDQMQQMGKDLHKFLKRENMSNQMFSNSTFSSTVVCDFWVFFQPPPLPDDFE